MKIRNECEYFAATFQTISNWNDIQIGIQRANKPNNFHLNDELQDINNCSLHQHYLNTTSLKECYSCYCIVVNLWDVWCSYHGPDFETIASVDSSCQCQRRSPETREPPKKQRALSTTYSKYVLRKFTQLCLVVLLLLPFLLTCNTVIQQASGQDVELPSTLRPISNSNIEFNRNLFTPTHKFSSSANNVDQLHEPTKTTKKCPNQWQTLLKLDRDSNSNSNSNYFSKVIRNRNRSIIKSKRPIYTSNHRLNGYSLIILSQSANSVYSGLAEASKRSPLNTDAPQTILNNAPKSAVNVNVNGSLIRTKRNIDIANNKKIKAKQHSKADSQKLDVGFEKHKENHHMYNRIINKEKLTKLVMNGLGLKKLPDMKKANISQLEYSSKYLEYLERLRKDHKDNAYAAGLLPSTLQILSIVTNSFSDISQKRVRQRRSPTRNQAKKPIKRTPFAGDRTNILLHFPLTVNDEPYRYEKLDEANVRLMMLYNPALAQPQPRTRKEQAATNTGPKKNCDRDYASGGRAPNYAASRRTKARKHILNLKVYQLLPKRKRQQLDARRIEFENPNVGGVDNMETRSQWLEFDVTEAVRGWLNKSCENLGIEIQCDKCKRIGARILSDFPATTAQRQDDVNERFHLAPVLNIIGHVDPSAPQHGQDVQSFGLAANNQSQSNSFYHHSNHQTAKKFPNSCYKTHQRCCRHQLDVAFKDIKGFEFIIQPKMFDAGYCRGRCPPRHNPAHHHALLQSLMWQQDHTRVPRPCCAPSKLTELEILHVDEEHSDKLKISTWSDMQVLECACS